MARWSERTDEERFTQLIGDRSDCWIWNGAQNGRGYGVFTVHRRNLLAHRWAYENWIGPIPEGLDVDHLCKNRICCNPAHLEPVSRRENLVRAGAIDKTHCIHGHEYTPDNIRAYKNKRACIICARERDKQRRPRGRR